MRVWGRHSLPSSGGRSSFICQVVLCYHGHWDQSSQSGALCWSLLLDEAGCRKLLIHLMFTQSGGYLLWEVASGLQAVSCRWYRDYLEAVPGDGREVWISGLVNWNGEGCGNCCRKDCRKRFCWAISWSISWSSQSCTCCWADCVLFRVICLHLSGRFCYLRMISALFFGIGLWSGYGCHIYSTPCHGPGSCLGNHNSHTGDIWDRLRGHSVVWRMLRRLLHSGKSALHSLFPWPSGTTHSGTPGVGTVRGGPGMLAGTCLAGISSHRPHGIVLCAAGPWFWASFLQFGWGIYIDWPSR